MFAHQVGFAFLETEDECTHELAHVDRWHGNATQG